MRSQEFLVNQIQQSAVRSFVIVIRSLNDHILIIRAAKRGTVCLLIFVAICLVENSAPTVLVTVTHTNARNMNRSFANSSKMRHLSVMAVMYLSVASATLPGTYIMQGRLMRHMKTSSGKQGKERH